MNQDTRVATMQIGPDYESGTVELIQLFTHSGDFTLELQTIHEDGVMAVNIHHM